MKTKPGQKLTDKHTSGDHVDSTVKEAIGKTAKNGEVDCAAAFKLAKELKISPADIGKALDLHEIKLIKCQLGLFGYKPHKKAVKAAIPDNLELKEAIHANLSNGKLSCIDAWNLAKTFKVPRMSISAACEAWDIKIKPCQLGAF